MLSNGEGEEIMDTPKNCNRLKIAILSLIVFIFTPQVSYTQTATLDLEWAPNSESSLADDEGTRGGGE